MDSTCGSRLPQALDGERDGKQVQLIAPDPERHREWADLVTAFDGGPIDGSGYGEGSVPDVSHSAFADYLDHRIGEEDVTREPAPGRVHCTFRWIEWDGRLVGFLAVRHALNGYLYEVGGHIGYSVRPEARRRGIATQALHSGLLEARRLGIDPVLVTCHEDNVGSRRVIEANGGRFESTTRGFRRYWIGNGTPPRHPGPVNGA